MMKEVIPLKKITKIISGALAMLSRLRSQRLPPAPFQSDTAGRLLVKKSGTDQFLITSSIQPEFGIGSDSFKLLSSSHAGNRYYYRIKAVGSAGQASGIYVNHSPSPIAVATIY